ncbi:MAG: ABC transporter permease [Eubacteriales bacterium]|nr:ABC transporter permease [Eubacteriales bacterium]
MNKKELRRSSPVFPHVIWSFLFIVLPLIFVLYYAFTDSDGRFTFANILGLGDYTQTFLLSISMSVIATVICVIIAYPLAYFISKAKKEHQKMLLFLVLVPMWINLLIRTYSMMAIMDDEGMLNKLLSALNMGTVHLIGTKGAVIFGIVYDFLPYMVLPIYTVMSKLDKSLIEASSDLGCSKLQTVIKVILPLTKSGIISGVTMVFVPSISTFYISQKLGGGTFDLIGDTIERQFSNPTTYNIGAAISLVMMVLILLSLYVMNKFTGDSDDTEGMII